MPPVERRDYRCRLSAAAAMTAKGSALRSCRRHLLKRAWADLDEDEPRSLCLADNDWSKLKGRLKVGFDDAVITYLVPAYAEVYGLHPRAFNFGPEGQKIPVGVTDPTSRTQKTRYTYRHSEGIDTLSLCLASEEEYEEFCYISSSSHMSSTSESEICIGCCRGSSRPFCTAGGRRRNCYQENAETR